ncbi:hypothetical protein H0H93_014615 [Arthromyces matolae]|nr:hypothetical protein H0H93_014615 [Arthromyces matolae]
MTYLIALQFFSIVAPLLFFAGLAAAIELDSDLLDDLTKRVIQRSSSKHVRLRIAFVTAFRDSFVVLAQSTRIVKRATFTNAVLVPTAATLASETPNTREANPSMKFGQDVGPTHRDVNAAWGNLFRMRCFTSFYRLFKYVSSRSHWNRAQLIRNIIETYLERMSAVGTGLLLGAALGVIIPEGIETAVEASPGIIPTSTIALSLLFGFTFMLIIEQVVSPHAHSHSHPSVDHSLPLHAVKKDAATKSAEVDFEAELGELEQEEGLDRPGYRQISTPTVPVPSSDNPDPNGRAFSLTFGLVIHGLADGLALGASSLSNDQSGISSSLSVIVFLALIIHKAPTSLALTTSLLATSLPRAKCKKYVVIFASSTPLSAVASYLLFSFFGNGDDNWTAIALLVSGGTFLYVATVLQPVSDHRGSTSTGEMRPVSRVLYITFGMFVPFLLGVLLGHGH